MFSRRRIGSRGAHLMPITSRAGVSRSMAPPAGTSSAVTYALGGRSSGSPACISSQRKITSPFSTTVPGVVTKRPGSDYCLVCENQTMLAGRQIALGDQCFRMTCKLRKCPEDGSLGCTNPISISTNWIGGCKCGRSAYCKYY